MIRVEHVSKRFATQPVLHRVTFHVPAGKAYVILGQSGVGKSVLLKVLAGLLEPDAGRVRINTRDVGMLFQKNALFDSMTAFENLDFTLRERTALAGGERRERCLQFLDWVGLAGSDGKYPDELSGGMQKRLGIARALIVAPKVIFYDEPTAGLDPITSRMIIDLVMRLKRELKTTVVAVTSDVMRAFQLGDRIGLLARSPEGAHLIDAGSPEEARASRDAAVKQFITGATKGPLTKAAEEADQELLERQAAGLAPPLSLELDFNDPF